MGVGLMHALSNTAALDIDNMEAATAWLAERGVDLTRLLSTGVQVVSGNPNHGKLIYRNWLPMPTKRVMVDGKTILELRCATADGGSVQDVLPPSRHPSGSYYQWIGDWRNLPDMPPELLDLWVEMVKPVPDRPMHTGPATANTADLWSALCVLDPDMDRATWVSVGMALQSVSNVDQITLYELWNQWSMRGKKYKASEMVSQWKSFRPMDSGVSVGTLYHLAAEQGWRPPQPDVAHLFPDVAKATIPEVKQALINSAPIPDCDLSLWPTLLVERAKEVAAQVGCDPVVPLVAGLCAVSGAVDKRTTLNITPTWKVPPTIWCMTIGEPADKKTPGSKPMFQVLRQLEMEDRDRYYIELMAWDGAEAAYATQMKAFREFMGSPEAKMPGAVPPAVEQLPPKPEQLRILLNDATTQKVVYMAAARPRGFLVWMDEMAAWLARFSNKSHSDDRGCWIQGYETGTYTMDRVGAGSIYAENLALSMYGNCQPEVFRRNVSEVSADGLLQRFLPVILDAKKNAMWQEAVPEWMSHSQDYDNLIRLTYGLPVTAYQFSAEALLAFRTFCEWALTMRENERIIRSSSAYTTALGKIEGQCARLILLFHIVESPWQLSISLDVVERAIKVAQGFFYPMLRHTFNEIGLRGETVGPVLADYLIQVSSARPTVSMTELRMATKAVPRDNDRDHDEAIRMAMDELIGRGFAVIDRESSRRTIYAVNPELATIHREHRERVIQAKQFALDTIRASLEAKHGPIDGPFKAIGADSI
jgi:hypothetical protein